MKTSTSIFSHLNAQEGIAKVKAKCKFYLKFFPYISMYSIPSYISKPSPLLGGDGKHCE
jgi:hypothetical protein